MQNAFNQNTSENQDPLGAPEADLSAYYKGPDDPQIEADIANLEQKISDFVDQYKGNMADLDAPELAQMFEDYDDLKAVSEKLSTYAYLLSAKNKKTYGSFLAGVTERLSPLLRQLSFFSLEISTLEEAPLNSKIAAWPPLARYQSLIRDIRKEKPHKLGQTEEELLSALSPAGKSQWISLYEKLESTAEYRFENPETGETETLSQKALLTHTLSPNRDVRAAAYACMIDGLKKESMMKTHILNALVLEKSIMDEQRGYEAPISERNLGNNIEDDVVEALSTAVTNAYPRISHRYYELKRRELGLDILHPYDRVCPISTEQEDRKIPFGEAKALILDCFGNFSPRMAQIAQRFFDNNWIDARPTPGKHQGAFHHRGSLLAHRTVYLNYEGRPQDTQTLAHELGHGIHASSAAEHTQSQTLFNYPVTLAETASVFGEKLVFERQLEQETDPSKRKDMLATKMDRMLSTVVRQIAFLNFEKEVHARRKDGELSEEEINGIFLQTQKDSLGPAFDLGEDYGYMWGYVSHFFRQPFYVYSYAFGDCLVNALYQKYQEADDKADFEKKFFNILEAGGTKHHSELLAPLGIDLTDPAFWENAMAAIEKDIDRLEEAIATEKVLKAAPEQDNSPSS